MKNLLIISLVLFCGMGFFSTVYGANPMVLEKKQNTFSLAGHVEILRDENGTARIEMVSSEEYASRFRLLKKDVFQDKEILMPSWLKFTLDYSKISRSGQKSQPWFLSFSWPFINMIELYSPVADGKWRKQRAGVANTLFEPYGLNKLIALELDPGAQTLVTFYVKIIPSDSMPTTIEINNLDSLLTKARFASLLQGIFFGILVSMVLYNLAMWVSLRQNAYLWFVLSGLFLGLYYCGFNGIAYQFAPGLMGPWFYPPLMLGWLCLSSITLVLFARSFLFTRTLVPWIDKCLLVCLLGWAVGLVLIFTQDTTLNFYYLAILGMVFSVTLFIAALFCLIRGFKPALMFLIAISCTSIGGVWFSLTLFGAVPYSVFGLFGLQSGTAVEFVLFSLALTHRVRVLKQEKDSFKLGQERYKELSIKDSLTGLYNKGWLVKELKEKSREADKIQNPLTVAMFDLDHFKHFNDTYGHPAGDQVLIAMAQVMQSCLRKEDAACRYGGEEFTLILPGVDIESARDVAERIREKLSAIDFTVGETQTVSVTTSIGLSVFRKGEDVQNLLKRADKALYKAKSRGRNQTVAIF